MRVFFSKLLYLFLIHVTNIPKEHAVATGLRERGLWLRHPHAISYVHFTLFRWKHERYDWATHDTANSSVVESSHRSEQQHGSNPASSALAGTAVDLTVVQSLAEEPQCGGPQVLCYWPSVRRRRRFHRTMPNTTR